MRRPQSDAGTEAGLAEQAFADGVADAAPASLLQASLSFLNTFSSSALSPEDGAVDGQPPEAGAQLQGNAVMRGLSAAFSAIKSSVSAIGNRVGVMPAYEPFGLQLYLNPAGVTIGLHPDAPRPATSTGSGAQLPSGPSGQADAMAEGACQSDDAGASVSQQQQASSPVGALQRSASAQGEIGRDVSQEVADIVQLEHSVNGAPTDAQPAGTASNTSAAVEEVARAGSPIGPGPALQEAGKGAGSKRVPMLQTHRMYVYRERLLSILQATGALPASGNGAAGESVHAQRTPPGEAGAARRVACLHDVVPRMNAEHIAVRVQPWVLPEARTQKSKPQKRQRRNPADNEDAETDDDTGPGYTMPRKVAKNTHGAVSAHLAGPGLHLALQGRMSILQHGSKGNAALKLPAELPATEHSPAEIALEAGFARHILQLASLQARPTTELRLSSDFEINVLSATAKFAQCAVAGSGADAASRLMAALQADSAAMQSAHERVRRRWWNRHGGTALAGTAVSGVAVLGGVRYIDASCAAADATQPDDQACQAFNALAAALERASAGLPADAERQRRPLPLAVLRQLRRGVTQVAADVASGAKLARAAVTGRLSFQGSQAPQLQAPQVQQQPPPRPRLARSSAPSAVPQLDEMAAGPSDLSLSEGEGTDPGSPAGAGEAKQQTQAPQAATAGPRADAVPVSELLFGTEGTDTAGGPCVHALIVAESLSDWQDVSGIAGIVAPARPRRSAVQRLIRAAQHAGLHIILVPYSSSHPRADSSIWTQLNELRALRAAYNLHELHLEPGAGHTVLPLDESPGKQASCAKLHEAVVGAVSAHGEHAVALGLASKL